MTDSYGFRRIAQTMVDAAVTSAANARITDGSRMSKAGLLSEKRSMFRICSK